MGICQSNSNLNDHIDQNQTKKAEETESSAPSLTASVNANHLKNGGARGGSAFSGDENVDDEDDKLKLSLANAKRVSIRSESATTVSINNNMRLTAATAAAAATATQGAPGSTTPPSSSSTSTKSTVSSFIFQRNKSAKKADDKKAKEREVARRKESLQRKINILTFATQKIDQYKEENTELKDANVELNEINSELKEYIDDKNDIIVQQEQDLKDLESKILRLEQEVIETKHGNSINDILYKVQGECVSKLKYTKMSAKRVIFINGINHLFYYDETAAAAQTASASSLHVSHQLEAKCIVVRDILICHDEIESALPVNKAWFLIIGAKRKALFIAESSATRDKWLYFIQSSLNNAGSASLNRLLNNSSYAMSISTRTQSDYLQIPRHSPRISVQSASQYHLQHTPNIITSPRSGNIKIFCESEEFEYKALSINYPTKVTNCTIINNGHTVQINIHQSNKCKLNINDGNLYRLKQFHFHTPSEHTIYGKQYEMELHLVHVNESNDNEILILCFIFSTKQKYHAPQLELNESKTHLIRKSSVENYAAVDRTEKRKKKKLMHRMLSSSNKKLQQQVEETEDDETDVECEWIEDDENRNDFLDQFWPQMPPQKTKEEIPLNKPLNFDFLFKTASDNFIKNIKTNDVNINMAIYDYVGSLRTPPYTEGVKWLISKKTHFINYKQLNTLKKIWYHYL